MNKAGLILTLVFLTVLSALSASAALTVADVTFGDESQERNETVTKTFTITNAAATAGGVAETITGVQFLGVSGQDVTQFKLTITSVTVGLPASSNLAFSNGAFTGSLAAGDTATVTVQANVPKKFDAVDANLAPVAFQIATINVLSTTPGASSKAFMQAKNKLTVDDMNVAVNGESQSVSNNERVDNLKPGDKLELEVIAKNQFSDRSDVDVEIEDVLISVRSSDLDQLDVDDEEDVGTLSAKSDDSARFDITVDDSTDDSTYTLTIKVTGVDENGGKHGEKQTVRLKVERETHEVAFKRVTVLPTTVECDGSRLVTVDATINNIGQRDEDDIVVQADVPQLKFTKKITGVKLDDGKSKTVQFPIDLPEDADAGSYRVDLTTFFENVIKSNTKSVSFTVDACEFEEEEEEEPVVVTQPPVVTPPPATTETTAPKARVTTTQSFTDSWSYVYLLAGVSALLLFFFFVLVVVLATRRRRYEDD